MAPTGERICTETRALLQRLLDDELAPDERARVERHVASCPPCADELARAKRSTTALRALPVAEKARLRGEALAELGIADETAPRGPSRLARFIFFLIAFALAYYWLREHRTFAPDPPRGAETR